MTKIQRLTGLYDSSPDVEPYTVDVCVHSWKQSTVATLLDTCIEPRKKGKRGKAIRLETDVLIAQSRFRSTEWSSLMNVFLKVKVLLTDSRFPLLII